MTFDLGSAGLDVVLDAAALTLFFRGGVFSIFFFSPKYRQTVL